MGTEVQKKQISESKIEQSYIIMPKHINQNGHLFGGQLVAWIDETAGLVALRHSQSMVVTASIDKLVFISSVKIKDIVVLNTYITYTGRTSMEIKVDSYVWKLDGTRKLINEAYVSMVTANEDFRPVEVPGLILDTAKEKEIYQAGYERYQRRKN